jgi:MFS family permease
VWLLSLVLFIASMLVHLTIGSVHGPAVYLARMMMMTSLAGAFGASITFVSLRVPPRRMAEMIGTLGSSGFIGIALGPTLGDFLFGTGEVGWFHVSRMFLLAGAMGVISLISAAIATRGHIRRPPSRRAPVLRLVRRYHPGLLLIVAMAVGWGVGLPGTFLRPYAQGLGIHGLKTFFLVYAAAAFLVRLSTRRWPDRFGVRPMLLAGFGSLSLSMLLYMVVQSDWWLVLPAMAAGTGHAFLFPSVTAGGCASFPARYRGLATTLMLAMFDMGNLLGQPVVGGLIEFSGRLGMPAYATMFVTMSVGFLVFSGIYAWFSAWEPRVANSRSRVGKARKVSSPSRIADKVEFES